jgi:hypothetical protein
MKTVSLVFVSAALFGAAACKKGDDCAKAIDHSMELSKATMSKMPGMHDKMMEKMKDIGIERCKQDNWPDEALKCMSDAKTEGDAQGCYGKLSHEQQEKMNKAAMEMAKPTGVEGSGSATAPR